MTQSLNLQAAPYNAVGDGHTDDTTAVEQWLSAIAAAANNTNFAPSIGYAPAGIYKISRPLRMPPRNNWAITGDGRYLSSFAYAGPALGDSHFFEIGDETTNSTAVQLRGLSFFSLAEMSPHSSFALKANRLANSSVTDVTFGGEDYNYRYGAVHTANGVWFNGAHQVFVNEFDCRTKGDGMRINAIDDSSCNDLYLDQGLLSGNGKCGLRCAGGFGGLYLDQVVLLANGETNLTIDSSEANRIADSTKRTNREIILGANTVCDGVWSTPHCILVDDRNANGGGLVSHAYIGSAALDGIHILRWANSVVALAGGRNYNNHHSAVVNADPKCRLVIGSGVLFGFNTAPIENHGVWDSGDGWMQVPVSVHPTQGGFYAQSAHMRFSVIGSTVNFAGVVNLTSNGTGSGAIVVGLPVPARADSAFPAICCGREDAVSGAMLQGVIRGNTLTLVSYDNSYPGRDGARLVFGGSYELAP
jgi:hypothetical protein